MQTFLPYADLRASSVALDDRRLGKQRVETLQILRALTWTDYAWRNHPAVRMWRGFVPALVRYGRENCREWCRRGYADTVAPQLLEWTGGSEPADPALPPWFGWEPVHRSHRSALLRKDPAWYRPLFDDPGESAELPYVWPPDVFPRWPIRSGGRALGLSEALWELGLVAPRPGQAEAAKAVAAGRDVLLVMRSGAGGSTTGLLAGLMTPGRTAIVRPAPTPVAGPVPRIPHPPARPASTPVPAGAGPSVSRVPGPADVAAMRAEAGPPEFVFHTSGSVPADRTGEFGLLVVDDPASSVRVGGGPPVLVIVARADARDRAEIVERHGLRDPVHVGGGWDPRSFLDAVVTDSVQASAGRVVSEVRAHGPALVICPSRARADRRAARLVDAGLQAQVWSPPPMRPKRAAEAISAWRRRRLDALVVPAGQLPPWGRVHPALLIGDDVDSADTWRRTVAEVGAVRSLLIAGPDADPQTRAHAGATTCLRRDLLELVGEPVAVPCAACSRCASDSPAPGSVTAP